MRVDIIEDISQVNCDLYLCTSNMVRDWKSVNDKGTYYNVTS